MKYEIVRLPEKTVSGLAVRTNNFSPDMGQAIGEVWKRFYEERVYQEIPNKKTGAALGIYTDYASDERGDYTFLAACEVISLDGSDSLLEHRVIPAGSYARFTVTGNVLTAVADCWKEIWKLKLPRSFAADFEEYTDSDMENAVVNIYIGLKEECSETMGKGCDSDGKAGL